MIFFISLEGFQSTGGRYPSTCLIIYLATSRKKNETESKVTRRKRLISLLYSAVIAFLAVSIRRVLVLASGPKPDTYIPSVQSVATLVIDGWWRRRPQSVEEECAISAKHHCDFTHTHGLHKTALHSRAWVPMQAGEILNF